MVDQDEFYCNRNHDCAYHGDCRHRNAQREMNVPPNFGGMGVDEDPDAFDRMRDEGWFDDYRYTGKEPWQ